MDKGPSPLRACAAVLALALAIIALAVALLVLLGGDARAETNLTLGPVGHTPLDTDLDGLDDSVRVNASVSNNGLDTPELYTVLVTLWRLDIEIDAKTKSEMLPANTTANVSLDVGTADTSLAATYTVVLELHAGDLTGPMVAGNTSTASLYPMGDYTLEVTVNRTSVVVLENDTVTFTVTVLSLSNNPTGVDLSYESPLGWPVELDPLHLQLAPSANAECSVMVHVPHNEHAGTLEHVIVRATATRNGAATGSDTMAIQVAMQLYDVRLEIADPAGHISSGQTLRFVGYVHNLGNNLDNVSLESDAPLAWSVTITPTYAPLDRGGSAQVEVRVTAPVTLAGSGMAIVNVTARSQGLTTFSVQSITLTYNSPELSIDPGNITVTPAAPYAGQEVTVLAKVLNSGTGPAEGLVVALLVDGAQVVRTTVPFVGIGERVGATMRWTSTPGYHRLTVNVDPDGTFPELDKRDNLAQVWLEVISPELAVSTTDLTMTPSYPTEGELANLSVHITNQDAAPAGTFNVTVSVDGTLVGTIQLDGLPGDGNTTVVYSWTAMRGRHTFRVELDPENATHEQERSNNVATRSFTANAMPVAVLTLPSDSVGAGRPVTMVGYSSSDPDGRVRQYFFDYGDGTNSGWTFDANVTHTYKTKGTYLVQLYVKDEVGAKSARPATDNVTVIEGTKVKEPTPSAGTAAAATALGAAGAAGVALRHRRRGDDHQ